MKKNEQMTIKLAQLPSRQRVNISYEPVHEISNNVVCATSKAYAQADQSLCLSLEYSMIVKLLTEHHLEFLSLKGGCRGSSESHLSKCQIVANLMLRLISYLTSESMLT